MNYTDPTGHWSLSWLEFLNCFSVEECAKAYDLASVARSRATQLYPGDTWNGVGDAFRHAYWNALMTTELGEVWAETFATAHEGRFILSGEGLHITLGGAPDAMETEMDLYNNALGRRLAQDVLQANPKATNRDLEAGITSALANGEGLIIVSREITWTDSDGVTHTETERTFQWSDHSQVCWAQGHPVRCS